MTDPMTEFAPASDEEKTAAALAVRDTRRSEHAEQLADTLTDRERVLVEVAYAHGANRVSSKVEKAVGSAAVTVDARAVKSAAYPSQILAEREPPFGYEANFLRIIVEALRRLERRSEAERGS